jgi:membrane fusion protein (multidrug efflux system)
MIKRLVIALILIIVVCGGLIGFNIFRSNAIKQYFATMQKPAVAVSTTVAEPVTWKPELQAIGTVSARSGVDLTVEVSGVVRKIGFKANDKVRTGQLLVQMDDGVQRANVDAEKAQAELDRQNLQRAEELQRRQVGPQSNVQQAQAAAAASAAQVESLLAVLDQKRLNAPFDGTIGIPQIDVGQYLTPGTIVATLQDLDMMRTDFTVPEQQLPELKIGQAIRLGMTGDDLKFDGRIIGINPKVDPATRLVAVRAEIDNPNGELTPGQFAQIRVELPPEENVIALPESVLITSLYGDFVYLVVPAGADGKPAAGKVEPANKNQKLVARQVFVKIGRRSDGRVEIEEGVNPGDVVVNAGQNRLTNGAAVTIDNTLQPAKLIGNDAR